MKKFTTLKFMYNPAMSAIINVIIYYIYSNTKIAQNLPDKYIYLSTFLHSTFSMPLVETT